MRIGIDARMYRSGVAGIGRYSQNLLKNLLEIDKKNQYVLFMTSADAEEFKMQSARCKKMPKGKIQNYKIVQTDIPHYSLAEQTKFARIIQKENLDLMHFLHFNVPINFQGKFVVTIHDLTLLFYPEAARENNLFKRWGFRYVIKKACQNSAKIIAVSENTKSDIVEKFQVPESKIRTIYEATDDKILDTTKDNIDRLQKKYNLTKPIILYVGQFRKHKNIEGLIHAFQNMKAKMPVKLVLLGGKKEDLGIDISVLKSDIVMPGFVTDEELALWYKIAAVFVIPSFYEGFGLPGLEAMTGGTPVVSSNKASLPEIYQDGAVYFDPFKTKDIAAKIKEVLINKKLRAKLIGRGKIVAAKYSWRKCARETLELYKQLENQKSE